MEMRLFTRALDAIEGIQGQVILLLYVLMIILVNFQVLNRFVLHWPIVWTADLSIVFFVWIGFLTASNAVRQGTHFRMRLVADLVGRGAMRIGFELFALLWVFILTGVLFHQGLVLVQQGLREISPGLQTPMAWSYAAIPVSMFSCFLFTVERLFVDVVRGDPQGAGEAR